MSLWTNPYWLHLRPRSWPIVWGHFTVGFLLAAGWDFTPQLIGQYLLATLACVIGMNGGTLALNSSFDQDDDDIGYLDNPPPIPRRLRIFALALLILGGAITCFISRQLSLVYAGLLVMSLLYSVPPFRLKSRPGFDVLINGVGYGMLLLWAGWATTDRPVDGSFAMILGACFFLFNGFYPLTQIYQIDDDLRHGDRTLTTLLGRNRALLFAITNLSIALTILNALAIIIGWSLINVLLYISTLAWLALMFHWWINRHNYPEKIGMYHALKIWAFTDLAIIIVFS